MSKVKQAALAFGAAVALGLSSTSSAQMAGDATTGWYAGASIGKSRDLTLCGLAGAGECDDSGSAYRLFGGYQVNRYLALELGYHDLTDVVLGPAPTLTIATKAYDLAVVGMLPLWEKVSLSGKVGVYHAESDSTSTTPAPPGIDLSTSTTGLTVGVGAQYEATRNLALRVEWQQFMDINFPSFFLPIGRDIEVLSVGAIWRFR